MVRLDELEEVPIDVVLAVERLQARAAKEGKAPWEYGMELIRAVAVGFGCMTEKEFWSSRPVVAIRMARRALRALRADIPANAKFRAFCETAFDQQEQVGRQLAAAVPDMRRAMELMVTPNRDEAERQAQLGALEALGEAPSGGYLMAAAALPTAIAFPKDLDPTADFSGARVTWKNIVRKLAPGKRGKTIEQRCRQDANDGRLTVWAFLHVVRHRCDGVPSDALEVAERYTMARNPSRSTRAPVPTRRSAL